MIMIMNPFFIIISNTLINKKIILLIFLNINLEKVYNFYKILLKRYKMSLILKKEPFKVNTSKINSIINTSTMKTTKNKSLIDTTGTSIFQLSQQQIHFLNTQLNEIYQVSMLVRNVSDHKQQIRVKKPKSTCLSICINKQSTIIAPGLDVKITVTYDSKDNEKIQDYFTIMSQSGYECDIPIHVIPQAGKLQFQPFINFGFIKIGNSKQVVWKISNKCENSTNIKLVPTVKGNCEIKIEPKSFSLQAKEERQVKLQIMSHEVGHCEGFIDIEPKLFSLSSTDFVANFCQYNRMISDDQGNMLTDIELDPLFAGQTVQVTTNLVNNAPKSCQFRISRKKGCMNEDQNNLITPQQFGKDDSQKLISFSPAQGVLQAYESIPLITKVQANFSESDQQLFCNYILGRLNSLNQQKQFSYTIKTHINQQETPLTFYLKGRSIIPKLALNSTFLDFGETPINSKKQKQLKIQNFSPKLVKIDFKNSANFTFSQKSIKISPKSNTNVIVTFCPKIVGQLNQVAPMIVGQFSFPIKLLGKGQFSTNFKKRKISPSITKQNLFNTNQIKCEEVKVQELDNTFLQNQISHINGDTTNLASQNRRNLSIHDQTNKTTVHFDQSYVDSINNGSMNHGNGNSFYLTQHKKSKYLRDRNGKQVKILDTSLLNPNDQIAAYPSVAKNQQQQRLVHRQLTSEQLTNIQVGPVVLNIGKIYLRSLMKKTFHICNFNSKPISIQLNVNNLECFSESPEQKQILPGHSWGGLLIKFQALKEGDFKYNLQYVINGKHFFEIMLTGTVIQPTLNVSRNQIKFFASEDDKGFEKKETLVLTNPYEYEVQFSVLKNVENSLFKVQPQSDKVPGNGSKTITILHNFSLVQEFGVKLEQLIKLRITHGRTIQIKCISMVPECNCISKSQQINFKQVAIGKSYESKIILKNNSKNFTIYKILFNKDIENIVTASTNGGSLHAEQMQEVIFKIQAFSSMNIDSNVSFLIRGGKTLNLPLKATIITPKIRIQNQKIDFGSTPIQGNPSLKTITLVNDSQIPIDLQFRLPYDSFLSQSLKINKIMDQNSQLISSSSNNNNQQLSLSNNNSKLLTSSQVQSANFQSIILRINPKSKSNLVLQFTPQQVTTYDFALPLYVYNSNESIPQLQKPCICKGIKNRLMAAQKQINFGKIIIQQNLQSYQKNKTLEIKNPQEEPIEWWVDDSNIYPFSLEKSRGKLQGYEKMNLKVFFYSDVEGEYAKELQFFIDQNQSQKETQSKQLQTAQNQQYLKIMIKASACYPTLYFDQPYVILPVVPLGEQSKSTFQIINGGYQNINIKHMIVQQYSNVQLKVNFLQGTNLGVTKKKIKVELSFKSDKPISFTVKINFYDTNNRIFSLPVSGTTDNCLYTMIGDERTNDYQTQIEKDCQFLKHYINSIGCLEDSLYEFPRSMIENQFQKFQQFLSNYSSAFQKIRNQLKKPSAQLKFFFSFDYLSEVIKLIKSQGGFLNQIRPELLLGSYEEYLQAIKMRASNNINVLSNYSVLSETDFEFQRKRCWVILCYQVFKVYSRVNVGKTKASEFWAKFSQRQKIITNWLQQAYLSQAKVQYQKKKSVLQQLYDSQLLSAIISKYTNIKVLQVYGRQIKGLKQKQRRVKNIIQTFNQIGINCHCRVEDIIRSNAKEMMLILEGLYLILPSYLQKGQPIMFVCSLGQTITKSIEISNPSKHPISYFAKIQGPNKAYVIQNQQQFVIQSKSTHEVRIKYISNINLNNCTATLTLTGKASAKFTPSTFIFVLKSQNQGRVSQKNIQVTGQLYEQYDFGINVQNNFQQDGQFKVQIINANQNKQSCLSFFTINNTIKIRKGESVNYNMMFIPLSLDNQKCLIIFRDPKVGQFQYQITGLVEMPQLSLDVLKIPQSVLTNKKYLINLPIPTRNDNLYKARRIIQSLVEKTQKKTSKTQQALSIMQKYFPKINPSQPYSVKTIPSNQMVQLRTDTIYIKQSSQPSIKQTQTPQQQASNPKQQPKIPLQINMKVAVKQASFVLLLKNTSGTDVRRYKVLVSSLYKPLKYEIEMKTSINKSLQQKLPLVNINNESNTFYVTMQANQVSKGGIFLLEKQKQVVVPGKSTENIALSFRPKNQITYNAMVKIQNVTTGQIIEYQISGIGQQPQADVLTFDQEIRKEKQYQIKLPIERTSKCFVSKFTLQDTVYDKNFTVNMMNPQSACFKFKFTAKIPGNYEGKLIIEDDTKVYAFKVVVNARDIIEEEIKIKTIQRKTFKGEITNIPQGQYVVTTTNSCLKFAKNFISNEKNKRTFKFQHYSTKPEEIESFIVFNNETVGQLTYLLKIRVDQMPEIKYEAFKTELGSRHEQTIKLQNHQDQPIKVNGVCSHPNIFFFEPANIVIPPKSELIAKLVYVPSKLELQQGKVNLISQRGQKWNYHLSGYGLLQSKPAKIQMRSLVGKQKIESISFINPLQKIIQATIELKNLPSSDEQQFQQQQKANKQIEQKKQKSHLEQQPAFQLILKSNKVELDYQQQIIIPIMIKSKNVNVNKCMLTITISQKIVFRYLLVGVAEYIYQQERFFRLQARNKKEDTIMFQLPYLETKDAAEMLSKATLKIVSLNENMRQLLKDSVKVVPKDKSTIEGNRIYFDLLLKSFKPFKTHTHFIVQLPNGCRWIQKFDINFTVPNADDKIEIVSEMNKPTSMRFKLTNRVKNHAKFKAYFATPTNEFTILPKSGELQPFGRQGTPFEITFLPSIYKKQWQGKLIIQTQQSYWSYDIKGTLPPYLPPIAKSLINNSSTKKLSGDGSRSFFKKSA